MASSEPKKIVFDISTLALIKIFILGLVVFFLFFVRDVILIVFVALILASAFDPWVDWMQKHKIPRGLGLLIIYFIVILLLAGTVYLIIPPIATEVKALSADFPIYWERISGSIDQFRSYTSDPNWV